MNVHPHIQRQLADLRMADLQRDAARVRVGRDALPLEAVAPIGKARRAVGRALVRIGLRLACEPATRDRAAG